MWVYSPLDEIASLPWNRKNYLIRRGINEIPEVIAQAYFLFGLPEEAIDNQTEFAALQRQALLRWGVALNSKPPNGNFLLQFILSETREGLEESVPKPETDNPETVKPSIEIQAHKKWVSKKSDAEKAAWGEKMKLMRAAKKAEREAAKVAQAVE